MDQYVVDNRPLAYDLSAQAFLSASDFADIRNGLVDGLLDLFENDHLVNRLILEEGRYMSYLTALALHAAQDMSVSSTWLTLGRLQREVTELGFASRNRVEAQISCLKKYGMLTQQPQSSDRRVRLLQPTAKMLERDATVLELHLRAIERLEGCPPGGFAGDLTPELHRAIRRTTLNHLESIGRLIRRHKPLAAFMEHDCGYMIMLLLLQSARETGSECSATCFQRLATQTGVSRTHVRRLLESVRDAGLLTLGGRGGHDIRLNEQMWHAVDLWFAQELALVAYLFAEARRQDVQPRFAA